MIAFYNFDRPTPDQASVDLSTFFMRRELSDRRCVAIDPCYGSNAFDCGAITKYSNVSWFNSNRKATFAWEHEAALFDTDGTLLNMGSDQYLIAYSEAFNPELCSQENSGRYTIAGTTIRSTKPKLQKLAKLNKK